MTKFHPTRTDDTMMTTTRCKLKPDPNNLKNPCINFQNQNNQGTAKINPSDKNSNNINPSEHKRIINDTFSTVTQGNRPPIQAPDVHLNHARSSSPHETNLPFTHGGAPTHTGRISTQILPISLPILTQWSGQMATGMPQSFVQRQLLWHKNAGKPRAKRFSTPTAKSPEESRRERINGE